MNKFLYAALWACALPLTTPALAADVGVSIQISQPGVYGRVDIGRFPQPQLVVAQPVIVQRPVQVVQPLEPVYLWVPPAHRQNWRRHCGRYHACGSLVYFVRDDWYGRHVRGHGGDGYRGDGRDGYRDDGQERGHDRGRGRGKGRGNDGDHGRGQGRGN